MSKLTAQQMDQLFDIEPGPNLDLETSSDYGAAETESAQRPFSALCGDLEAVMEKEDSSGIVMVETTPAPEEDVIPETLIAPVPEVGAQAPADTTKVDAIKTVEPEVVPAPAPAPAPAMPVAPVAPVDAENPLSLMADDLAAYVDIKNKYPKFRLYDGSMAFRSFYRHKVSRLKDLLSHFPLLPLSAYRDEIINMKLTHQVGDNVISPSLIQTRMDGVYITKVRLMTILSEGLHQFNVWKKTVEMLSAFLYAHHAGKGAHNRQALDLEHMSDMIDYVEELEGVIGSAKLIESFLKGCFESLSRQLATITTRHESGLAAEKATIESNDLDGYEAINSGTVINPPDAGTALIHHDFGGVPAATGDEFADIG